MCRVRHHPSQVIEINNSNLFESTHPIRMYQGRTPKMAGTPKMAEEPLKIQIFESKPLKWQGSRLTAAIRQFGRRSFTNWNSITIIMLLIINQ